MNQKILSQIFKYLKSRPSIESIGIEAYRQLLEKTAITFTEGPTFSYESFQIDHIQAQWLIPADADEKRVLLYVHGGGYIAGSIRSHKELACRIASEVHAKTLIFNYRLAPEHPFPAGLADVKKVYEWLLKNKSKQTDITIIGDSAGGGLSLALIAQLLEENRPLPKSLVLLSPWVDLACINPSHETNKSKDPMLGPKILKKTARLYTDKDLSHPLISPVHNHFEGCCPVLIQVGDTEVLLDDAKQLAQKLQQARAEVDLQIWKGMFHVWHIFARYLPQGRDAVRKIAAFIQQY